MVAVRRQNGRRSSPNGHQVRRCKWSRYVRRQVRIPEQAFRHPCLTLETLFPAIRLPLLGSDFPCIPSGCHYICHVAYDFSVVGSCSSVVVLLWNFIPLNLLHTLPVASFSLLIHWQRDRPLRLRPMFYCERFVLSHNYPRSVYVGILGTPCINLSHVNK
ncbi:hypothetical protein AVEN_61578-1 [Araneus ventricosus]|uniref:Uncharacterized protein n=1 Tax=Araneus ventricosus TaxID=182803 RepID=A0A4Y2SFI7_ARAVE|nr:hypothetical protein AVEN_61578-1 [Araneus ventricosus]